jgi:hypothetical protein
MNEQIYEKYGLVPNMDREIDPDELDTEWFEHTNLFGDYSDAYAIASKKRDSARLEVERAKEKVDRIKSDLFLQIKNDPEAFDLEKATDSTTEACVKVQPQYINAMEEYYTAWETHNQAKYEAEVLGGSVKTMEQRRSSLEGAMRLMAMEYFVSPNEPKDDPKARQHIKKIKREKTRKKIMEAMDESGDDVIRKKKKRKSK